MRYTKKDIIIKSILMQLFNDLQKTKLKWKS